MSRRKQSNPKSLKVCIDELIEEQSKTNATANKTNINELIQISNRLKEIGDDHLKTAIYQTESFNSKEKLNENDTHQYLYATCYDYTSKDENLNTAYKLSQKDDCFFKNMTNKQTNIEKRKIITKYSDSEELDVETFSGDENKEEVSSMKRCLNIENVHTNVVRSRSRNSNSKSSSRSRSNSTTHSAPNLDTPSHFRRLSYSSISSAASSSIDQTNRNSILSENQTHENKEKSNGVFLSKNRKSGDFKRNQRAKANNNTHLLQMNVDNCNLNAKQGTASILINGKRYYPLKFSCENCGLRYSDQGTLNTHKQNYCSKRNQNPTSPISRSSSSSSSSSLSSSSASSSLAPSFPRSPITTTHAIPTQLLAHQSRQETFYKANNKTDEDLINRAKNIIKMSERSSSSTCSNDSTTNNSSNSSSENEEQTKNEKLPSGLNHLNQLKNQHMLSNNIIQNINGVQLVKIDMYQCNYCLFQTDKKSAMNKHSRVHLPQKRKEMEESSAAAIDSSSPPPTHSHTQPPLATFNASSFKETTTINKETDKTSSYCGECDIQFSSMKTFLHHRNNYCQKFKTIESVVPIELATKSQMESGPLSNTNSELNNYLKKKCVSTPRMEMDKNCENQQNFLKLKPKVIENPETISFNPLNSTNLVAAPPPGALCMGDLVYVPVYKLKHNNINDEQADQLKNIAELKKKENESLDVPLDLSIKSVTKKEQTNIASIFKYPNTSNSDSNLLEKSFVPLAKQSSDTFVSKQINETFVGSNNFSTKNLSEFFVKEKETDDQSQKTIIKNSKEKIDYENLIRQNLGNQSEQQQIYVRMTDKKLNSNQSVQEPPSFRVASVPFGSGFSIQPTIIPLQQHHHHQLISHGSSYSSSPQIIQPKIVQKVSLSSPTPPNENKIYHCTACQQLFFKLKVFKRHQCIFLSNNNFSSSKNNTEPVINKIQHQENTPKDRIQMLNSSSINDQTNETATSRFSPRPSEITTSNKTSTNTKQILQKIGNLTSNDLFLSDNSTLLRHPLVVKTLLETYKVSSLNELNLTHENNNNKSNEQPQPSQLILAKNFFMCTACGYRGNTIRGVKQHGKSHLQEKEHFAIISAAEKQPLLVYYSLNDMELQTVSAANKRAMPSSLTVLSQDFVVKTSLSNDETQEKIQDSLLNKINEENSNGNSTILMNKSANDSLEELQSAQSQHQPVSKKARLLNAHQKMQDSLAQTFKCVDDSLESTKSDKSQTYCFKCNIQFQQINNYLVHKTNYCKDS